MPLWTVAKGLLDNRADSPRSLMLNSKQIKYANLSVNYKFLFL